MIEFVAVVAGIIEHYIPNKTELTLIGRYDAETKTLGPCSDELPLTVSPLPVEELGDDLKDAAFFLVMQLGFFLLSLFLVSRPFLT